MQLGSYLRWYDLLKLIDTSATGTALPMRVRCPLCGNTTLTLYQDTIVGVPWHHCSRCGSYGDFTSLLAKYLDVDQEKAILHWRSEIETVRDLAIEHNTFGEYLAAVGKNAKALDIFSDAVANLQHTRNLRTLFASGAAAYMLPSEVWRSRVGWLLGTMFGNQIVEQLRDGDSKVFGVVKMLTGMTKSELIISPVFDAPKHVCGFFVADRLDAPEFATYLPLSGVSGDTADVGFLTWDAEYRPHPLHCNTTVIATDPAAALLLHLRHSRDTATTLPLLATYLGRLRTKKQPLCFPRVALDNLPRKDYVIWCCEPSPAVFNLAARLDARVHCGSGHLQVRPVAFLEAISKTAKEWRIVLHRELREAKLDQIQIYAQDLDLPPSAEISLHNMLTRPISRAIRAAKPAASYGRAAVGNRVVIETAAGWFLQKDMTCVCDAKLRITNVIHSKDTQDTYYAGHIEYAGSTLEFCELVETIEQNTFRWMRDKILDAGLGVMRYLPTLSKHAIDIAMQLHPPRAGNIDNRIGWDGDAAGFRFPRFVVELGGRIVAKDVSADTESLLNASDPFPNPDEQGVPWDELTDTHPALPVFWATLAAVAANVVSVLGVIKPRGVALTGTGAETIGSLTAAACGCDTIKLQASYSEAEFARELQARLRGRRWPAIVEVRRGYPTAKRLTWVQDGSEKAAVMAFPRPWAPWLALQGSWTVIRDETRHVGAERFLRHAGAVMVAWLQRYAKDPQRLLNAREGFVRFILHDMLSMAAGDADALERAALRLLTDTSDTTEWAALFRDTLREAVSDGKLALYNPKYEKRRRELSLLQIDKPSRRTVFIPQATLLLIADKWRVPIPDPDDVTKRLAAASKLVGVGDAENPGWFISFRWWNDSSTLRVYG